MQNELQCDDYPRDSGAFDRFQRMTRALFRVDKRDVPKHEPKKRTPRTDDAATVRD